MLCISCSYTLCRKHPSSLMWLLRKPTWDRAIAGQLQRGASKLFWRSFYSLEGSPSPLSSEIPFPTWRVMWQRLGKHSFPPFTYCHHEDMLLSSALWNFRTKQWGDFLWTAYKSRNTLGIQGKNEWWSWLIPAMSGKWAQYSQVSSWQMHKGKMARLKSVLWENALGTSDHCGKNWGQADKDMRTHLVTSALTPPYQSHNFMLPHQGWHQNHLRKRQKRELDISDQ